MIGVLGDRETVIGFRIAGVSKCIETDKSSLETNLELMKDMKIIIMNEELVAGLGERPEDKLIIPVTGIANNSYEDMISGLVGHIIGEISND